MARPAEKARGMLNKWVKMREEGNATSISSKSQRRPYLSSDCEHLADAEYYRNQIVREISGAISKIQNPGLGEHAIRELNDEINHKFREKYHWNKRVLELGGPDYNAIEKKRRIEEGDDYAEGAGGYRYFGAAKTLPGVKELLEGQAQKKRMAKLGANRGDIYKRITVDYYGWREEEDGVLLEMERKAFLANKRRRIEESGHDEGDVGDDDEDDGTPQESIFDYLDVPTQEEVAKILLEEKKKKLLSKFAF
mmetsp:Transcript_23383/g.66232  ORF Transcript_23383/g.66232 Transcript_23383/m.66232 type:complete len:251 (+) Transcript_23383:789-1541(+)